MNCDQICLDRTPPTGGTRSVSFPVGLDCRVCRLVLLVEGCGSARSDMFDGPIQCSISMSERLRSQTKTHPPDEILFA